MSRKTDCSSTRLAIGICRIPLICRGCERREQAVLQPFVGRWVMYGREPILILG